MSFFDRARPTCSELCYELASWELERVYFRAINDVPWTCRENGACWNKKKMLRVVNEWLGNMVVSWCLLVNWVEWRSFFFCAASIVCRCSVRRQAHCSNLQCEMRNHWRSSNTRALIRFWLKVLTTASPPMPSSVSTAGKMKLRELQFGESYIIFHVNVWRIYILMMVKVWMENHFSQFFKHEKSASLTFFRNS